MCTLREGTFHTSLHTIGIAVELCTSHARGQGQAYPYCFVPRHVYSLEHDCFLGMPQWTLNRCLDPPPLGLQMGSCIVGELPLHVIWSAFLGVNGIG